MNISEEILRILRRYDPAYLNLMRIRDILQMDTSFLLSKATILGNLDILRERGLIYYRAKGNGHTWRYRP